MLLQKVQQRQFTTIKQAFIKNYDDIDDNYNSLPSLQTEVETWTSKKKLKRKKITAFNLNKFSIDFKQFQ